MEVQTPTITVNQTQIIRIRKGDDSDFRGYSIKFNISSSTGIALSLTGYTAEFRLQKLIKTYSSIAADNSITLVISKADTKRLSVGPCNGFIKLFDADGNGCTSTAIKFLVESQEVC